MNSKNKMMTRVLVWVLIALMVLGAASLTIPAIINKVQANKAAKEQQEQQEQQPPEGPEHRASAAGRLQEGTAGAESEREEKGKGRGREGKKERRKERGKSITTEQEAKL